MSLWNWKKSGWVNSSLAVFLIIAVIISICSTGFRNGFKATTPNFSFRGELHPEIGVFNILLFFSATFGLTSVALRYSFIMDQVQVMPIAMNYLNKISASAGFLSFMGLLLIASFSATVMEMINTVQLSGAYLFVGFGIIFTTLQTALTYTSSRISIMFILRSILSVLLIGAFISSIIFAERSKKYMDAINDTSIPNNIFISSDYIKEAENVQAQREMIQLIAGTLEWISVIVYALFFLSFFKEFQTISAYVIMRPFISSRSSDFRTSSLTVNERV